MQMNNNAKKKNLTVVERIIRDDKIKKALVRDNRYFNWLAEFTDRTGGGFRDDDWLYYPDRIDPKDSKMVEVLHLFFMGIHDYAEKHNIEPDTPKDFSGESLNVNFKKTNYKLGCMIGQGSYFYCKKIDDDIEANNLINFKDVVAENNQKDLTI